MVKLTAYLQGPADTNRYAHMIYDDDTSPGTIELPVHNDEQYNIKYDITWDRSGGWGSSEPSVIVERTASSYTIRNYQNNRTIWFFKAIAQQATLLVEYDLNGGSSRTGGSVSKNYVHNELFVLPTNVNKTGYTLSGFEGPFSGVGLPGTSIQIKVRMSGKIKAKWTLNNYMLSYIDNGETYSGNEYTPGGNYNHNHTIVLPLSRIKEGYKFDGFNVTGSSYTSLATTFKLTETTQVEANWTIEQYELTLKSYPILNREKQYTQDYKTTRILPTLKAISNTFKYWKNTDDTHFFAESEYIYPAKHNIFAAVWITKTEIEMLELHRVFSDTTLIPPTDISLLNYFSSLELTTDAEKRNIKFSTKIKGKGPPIP